MSWASLHILKGWTDLASFQRGDLHSARLCLSIRHAEDCVRTLHPDPGHHGSDRERLDPTDQTSIDRAKVKITSEKQNYQM